ncbi:MAG: tRNA (adenosine(37)-N6)-threonylcarbamoyltransferase complex dimerization subunit type 1 TsaB [Bulleidia sp.]|nr:tRNA (adenosine(37)-N6)-threonylcarbamoyltransferase complex dimerization subunit type 1 TsaB [Bulleidia sp.]
MITLCMDTSHIFLALSLIRDDQIIGRVQEKCWKKQSEEIFPKLQEMMDQAGLKPADIDQIVVSEGPGSYTGVRIAMTIAKVFCAMRDLPIATISTLQLYAGMGEKVRTVLDARGGRVYTGLYEKGVLQGEISVEAIEDVKNRITDEKVAGDGHLVGKEDVWPDLAENFLAMKAFWKKADNVHLVKPEYLKSSESYLVHKKQ